MSELVQWAIAAPAIVAEVVIMWWGIRKAEPGISAMIERWNDQQNEQR